MRNRLMHTALYGLALIGLGTGLGCGGGYESTVQGIVTLDSKTVPTGTVSFSPQSSGPAVFSLIDEQGHYKLRTGKSEGLPAGQYAVSISATGPSTGKWSGSGPRPSGKPITPAWYANPSTSGLTFTVEPGDNEINLELTSTPPAGWKPPAGRR